MSVAPLRALALVAMALLSACTPVWDRPARRALDHPAPSTAAVPSAVLAEESGADTPPPDLPASTTLEGLIELALQRNPGLRAARERALAAHARIGAVAGLPDPMLQVTPLGELAETAAGEVALMAMLSQRLPWPGRLGARAEAAAAMAEVATAQWRREAIELAATLRKLAWRAHLARRSIELVQKQQGLLDDLLSTVEGRVAAGIGEQSMLLRLAVERAELDAREAQWRGRLREARAGLRGALSLSADAALPTLAALPPPPRRAPDGWRNWSERVHPAIVRGQASERRALALLRGARLAHFPDLTVSASYNVVRDEGLSKAATGDDQWWVSFGVNLPIWVGRIDADKRSAAAELRRSRALREAALDTVRTRYAERVAVLEASRQRLTSYRERMLPAAADSLESVRAGYAAGRIAFTDLLDAWRRLLQAELATAGAESEYGEAWAALLAAAGLVRADEAVLSQGDEP